MLCNHCGSQIDDDAMFCPVCGKAVTGGETARPAAGTAQPSGGAFQPAGTIAQPAAGKVQPPAAKKKSPLPLILGAAGIAAAAAAVFMLVVVPMQNRKKAFEVTDAFMKAVDAGDFDSAMQYFSEDMKDSRIEGFREINDGIQELIKPLDDAGLKDSYPAEYREICASAEEFKTTVFNNLLREYSLKESDIKADRTQASAPVSVKIISDISFDDYLDEEMIEQLSMTYMGANMDKVLAYAFSEDDAAMEADMMKTMYPAMLKAVETAFEESPSSEELWTIQTSKIGDEWKITGLTSETVKEAEKSTDAEIRQKKQKILAEMISDMTARMGTASAASASSGAQSAALPDSQSAAQPYDQSAGLAAAQPAAGTQGQPASAAEIDDFLGGWSGASGRWGLSIAKTGKDEVSISYSGSLGAESYEEMTAQGKWDNGRIIYGEGTKSVYEYDEAKDDFVQTEIWQGYGALTLRDRNFDPDSTDKNVLAPDGEEFYAASKYLVWESQETPVWKQPEQTQPAQQQPAASAASTWPGVELSADEVQQSILDARLTADGYILPDADRAYISRDYLQYFSQDDLRLAVNEIYARHGRRFNSADLQNYFDQKTWYQGTIAPEAFDESVLNAFEKENAKLIDSMRSH